MPDRTFASIDDVVATCDGDLISIAVPNLELGGVRLVCGTTTLLVATDDLPELNRRGVFHCFVVDYLRSQLLL